MTTASDLRRLSTSHGCEMPMLSYPKIALVVVIVTAMMTVSTSAFQLGSKSSVHGRSSKTHSRFFVIPGQGYDPNYEKERRNQFIADISKIASKKKAAYENPYMYRPPQKKRAMPWSSQTPSRQRTPWASTYVPSAQPSVASNDLINNFDYLRQQSQEAAMAANELLERNRQDLLRRSQEASERAESFLISSREAAVRAAKARQERHFTETTRFIATPFLAAVVSFFLYPTTSKGFHAIATFCSQNNWVPVDGGNLQWSVLLPALNGVVMTAVSLLYANLISTTGTALRNRQIKIQESLRTEVSGVRGLAQLLPYYPDNGRAVFGTHLMAYIQQLVIELDPKSNYMDLRTIIPPLWDYRDELHRISLEDAIHDSIRERSYEMLDRVATGRQNRVTALQETFPPLHYGTITALSLAILFVFLIETDRPVILFLNNYQLRLIWGLLVGTITAIYCIGIDLNFPFVGTYTVPADRLLNESDEIMREIKGTFPDLELLEMSNAVNGPMFEDEEKEEEVLSYAAVAMEEEEQQQQSQMPPVSPPAMSYADTTQDSYFSGVNGNSSPDWSQMSVEEMNRRWIEGK